MIKRRFVRERLLGNQSGAVGVMAGTAFSTVLLMMTLSFDVGYIFCTQTELQNTADAASLAAVTTLPVTSYEAKTYANDVARDHKAGGVGIDINFDDIVPGRYDFKAHSFSPGVAPINAAEVTASRDSHVMTGNLALFFARLAGHEDIALNKRALAAVDPRVVGVKGNSRLLPFAVHQSLVDANGDGVLDVGADVVVPIEKTAPGNFLYLDFDGGSNGVPEIRDFIIHGYPGDVVIPPSGSVEVLGKPGILGASDSPAFEQVYGMVSFFPVFTTMSETGANGLYTVVDFVAIVVDDVVLTGPPQNRHMKGEIVRHISSNFITREGADANASLQKLRLIE